MDLDLPVCRTCGVQYPPEIDRAVCPVCSDERQYVGWDGQRWTSLAGLRAEGHRGEVRPELTGVWGVGTTPSFAIGQRALLVPGEGGNVLWDCVTHLDDETVHRIRELGGVAAIALSHPHYYGAMGSWSEAFGDVPVYVHADDAQWVPGGVAAQLWTGTEREILPGRTLVHAGVHFAGGTVLHWAEGPDGRGALCAGDIFTVVADRRWVGFMYSYPNLIPEHPDTIRRAVEVVSPYRFETLYGAWWNRVVTDDARAAVIRSAHRYLTHLGLDASGLPSAG